MMKNIIAFIFVFTLGLGLNSGWAKGIDVRGYAKDWNVPSDYQTCISHDSDLACIAGYNGCGNWNNGNRSSNRGTYDDEMALLMLVAREINANGAKFCVTQVQGANENRGKAWTTYYEPSGASADCVWLCKGNFQGDECKATSPTSCNTKKINKDKYSKYKIVTSTKAASVESKIPMFYWDDYRSCGVHKSQEHDVILMVTKWLDNGHGAWVAPVIFRAERSGWRDMISTATLRKATNEQLLCMNGYEVKDGDCIESNKTLCELDNMCSGWTTGYNSAKHETKLVGNCYEYRCTEPTEGFRPGTKTCTECIQTANVGIVEQSGVCVTCPLGKLYSATSSTGCRDAQAVSQDNMKYGIGKSVIDKLDLQCWTHGGDYKKCVFNLSD